jgi:predicted Zn-dependent peptidase
MVINYKRHKLPNGARLYYRQRSWSKTFAVWLSFKGLYYAENPQSSGISYLALKMLFEGTEQKNFRELALAFEQHGIDYSISPAGIQFLCADGKQQIMLELITEIICHPVYTEERFQKIKKQTLMDYRIALDDADTLASEEFRSQIFRNTPIALRPGGNSSTIAKITLEECIKYQQAFFNCANISLFAAGCFNEKELLNVLQKKLSNGPNGKEYKNRLRKFTPPQQFGKLFVLKSRESSSFVCGHRGICRWTKNYSVLKFIDCILGSGSGLSSRLNRRIREELGLCYHIYSDMTSTASRYPGFLHVCAGTAPERVEQIYEEVGLVFSEFLRNGPNPEEMENTRLYLRGSLAFQAETNASLIALMRERVEYKLAEDFLLREQAEIELLRPSQVIEVAREHYFPAEMSALVVGKEPVRGFLEHIVSD